MVYEKKFFLKTQESWLAVSILVKLYGLRRLAMLDKKWAILVLDESETFWLNESVLYPAYMPGLSHTGGPHTLWNLPVTVWVTRHIFRVHHILEWETLWQTLVSENLATLEKIRTPIQSLEKLIRQFPCWYSISPNKQFQYITVWLFLHHLYFQTHYSKPLLFTFFILSHQIIIKIPSICELKAHISKKSAPPFFHFISLSCILSQELN